MNVGCPYCLDALVSLNLITLDSEHLGIPETTYTSEISMNSSESYQDEILERMQ